MNALGRCAPTSNKPYLNVGCGSKYHVDWTNIDMKSSSPDVQAHNLLQGFPYPSDHFEVVYHPQVLEHFPKEKAPEFLAECFRVLKPGGIVRVVVPDLENIAREYLRHLGANIENPTKRTRADYDWITLELYDQAVRNYSGGQMARYFSAAWAGERKLRLHPVGAGSERHCRESPGEFGAATTSEEKATLLHLTQD